MDNHVHRHARLGTWVLINGIWYKGRHILFVYSESPNWQEYIEVNILPRISDRSVVINWSERRFWSSQSSWEAHFFYRFAGHREFNPMALVFCARGRIKVIRFHQAFLDLKYGNESTIRAAEAELFTFVT